MAVKVKTESCIGCGTCVDECKFGALLLEGEIVIVREEDCTLCGDCVAICVTGALEL
ncbi:MAG: 4Fe-4S binding protein [Candidatus Schekmanbacteria bacterium]|nr:4Fe-4S binding protein [Candidatus Schekmanbacteria bacterium]